MGRAPDVPAAHGAGAPGRTPRARHFGEQRSRIRRSLRAWNIHVPRLSATWGDLGQAYARSVSDLAALRMRGSDGVGLLPAAGMPWFMTVFGRDTIITCLQTLVFGPELAHTALRVLTSCRPSTMTRASMPSPARSSTSSAAAARRRSGSRAITALSMPRRSSSS